MRHVLAFVLAAAPVAAPAAEWVYITTRGDEALWSLDADSVRQKSGYVQVWTQEITTSAKAKGGQHVEKYLTRVNCDDETIGIASEYVYSDLSATTLVRSDNKAYPTMVPIPPESIAEKVANLTCGINSGDASALAYVQRAREINNAAERESAGKRKAADDAALGAAEEAAGLRKRD